VREGARAGHQAAHEGGRMALAASEGAGGGTVAARRERCAHCVVAWFCCSVGTRVSSKMDFGYYWADWADIGKSAN
jgi:hypothetical protein